MDQYVEGSTRAKVWFFSLCGVVALALVLLYVLFPYPDALRTAADIQALAQTHLARAVLLASFLVPFSFRVITLARRSAKHGQWPPPGIPLPFRTRVKPVRPGLVYALLAIVLCAYLVAVAASFYGWY